MKALQDERTKRDSKKREEREERLKRTERTEYELQEKKKNSTLKKQQQEEKALILPSIEKHNNGVKKMIDKLVDNKTDKEIERIRNKKLGMVSDREEERRTNRLRDMERDERILIMTAGTAADELLTAAGSGGGVVDGGWLVAVPSLWSGVACHAQDGGTVGRVLHYLYTMYLTMAVNVPSSSSSSSTASSPLKPLNTAMYDNGAVGLLVGCLFDHSENAAIQQDALLLLYCLCTDKAYAETCINNGGITAIAIALTNHPTLPLLLAACIALLTRLATHLPQYVLLMLQSDVLPLLLSALAAHPNNELLAYHALGAFSLLCASSSEQRVLLGESGVVECVIMAMYTFPNSYLLQREALHALSSLCNEQIENGRKIYRNSGIQASMLAVSKHAVDDVEVLQSALKVLMELEWQHLITQKALEAVDGLAVLLTAAAAHITLLDVQRQLMATVAVACEHSVELQSKAIARGVVDHLEKLIKQFNYTYGTEQLWAAMCQCARYLSTADVNKVQLSNSTLMLLVLSALKLHSTSDSVALQAMATVAHLTDHADDSMRRQLVAQVGDKGGMTTVSYTMECHSSVRAVIEQCVIVLYNLLRNHVDYQRQWIQADGIPSLLTACKDHSSSETVCRHVLAIFSLLSDSMDEKELFLRMHGDSINQILIAMRNHPASLPLQCFALLTLRNLTNKFDCGPTKSSEIIDVTLVKMKAFTMSAAVQQYACECLWNLVLTDSVNKRKMQAGEGIALVLAARRMHAAVFDVTHATNGLLDVLECSIAEEGKEEKSMEQLQEDQIQREAELLLVQMAAAEEDVNLQLHGMDRLCALAAASTSIHPLLLVHLEALFTALRSHPDTELIQLAGLNILGRLSSTATAVAAVTEHGGIIAALTALSPIPSSSLLLENAVSLLRLLAGESTNCYLIGRTGGLELVLEGMAAFRQLVSVQEQTVRCVGVLLVRDENKQRLMAAGGLDVLAAALQACAGRSVMAAETVLAAVDAMLRWGGGGVMSVNMYWALLNTAHAFPWHAALQQQCGAMLPYFHHLTSQQPRSTPPITSAAAAAAAAAAPAQQERVAGPPGGAAYAAGPMSPHPTLRRDGVKAAAEEKEVAVDVRHQVESNAGGSEDEEHEEDDDEEDEEEDEEDEDEDEEQEAKDDEDDGDDEDVKEGEERTPVTTSPAAESEVKASDEDNTAVDSLGEELKEERHEEKERHQQQQQQQQHHELQQEHVAHLPSDPVQVSEGEPAVPADEEVEGQRLEEEQVAVAEQTLQVDADDDMCEENKQADEEEVAAMHSEHNEKPMQAEEGEVAVVHEDEAAQSVEGTSDQHQHESQAADAIAEVGEPVLPVSASLHADELVVDEVKSDDAAVVQQSV